MKDNRGRRNEINVKCLSTTPNLLEIFLMGVIFVLSLGMVLSCRRPIQTSTINTMPNVQHDLPIGTTSKDVDVYLKKSGLEYSFDKASNAFYAIRRGNGGLVKASTQIVVQLDGDGKVAKVSVTQGYTGP
jgi:hypothetical protein